MISIPLHSIKSLFVSSIATGVRLRSNDLLQFPIPKLNSPKQKAESIYVSSQNWLQRIRFDKNRVYILKRNNFVRSLPFWRLPVPWTNVRKIKLKQEPIIGVKVGIIFQHSESTTLSCAILSGVFSPPFLLFMKPSSLSPGDVPIPRSSQYCATPAVKLF